jgi:lincosamide nucleotidyltransferase A/C/D/E
LLLCLLYQVLDNILVYVDGGWGIDALLGKQTRLHGDLDIAIQHKDVHKLRELLKARGYNEVKRTDTKDYNFVLSDSDGHEIDVHSYTFDSYGKNIYGIAYPAASLTGKGMIGGNPVNCIALEWVIKFHENYEPDEVDLKDIKALCDKFGVNPPKNYGKTIDRND